MQAILSEAPDGQGETTFAAADDCCWKVGASAQELHTPFGDPAAKCLQDKMKKGDAMDAHKGKKGYKRKKIEKNVNTNADVRKRMIAIGGFCGVFLFSLLLGHLFRLMIVKHDYYETKAIQNQTRSTAITASRGMIYDRNMEILAASVSVENVILDPLELSRSEVDVSFLAKGLADILDVDADWIKEQAADTEMRYKIIKRRQPQEVADQVREFINENKISGVYLEADSKRYYPGATLAAQLIGFTNADNIGAYGIEAYYNNYLEGTAGAVVTTKGNYETEMLYSFEKYYEASDGDNVVLTIDSNVQRILEKNVNAAVEKYEVQNGAFGIVMDVDSGEVLGMVNVGTFDPNNYTEICDTRVSEKLQEQYDAAQALKDKNPSEEETDADGEPLQTYEKAMDAYYKARVQAQLDQWNNRCITGSYEPGSTFKLVTLAAALDSGAITENSSFYCGGKEDIPGRSQTLNCWKATGHGAISTAQALQNSCNIAFAHIGLDMGGETLYDYMKLLGVMEKTGIDLPGEEKGVNHTKEHLADTKRYGTSYLTTTSFGQSIKVTPIQLVRAIAAIVNGGYVLEPYVVSEILDADGNIVQKNSRTVIRQAISEETSELMRQMMESVVTEGTAKNAKIVGYRIGGKTGTAEKLDVWVNGVQTSDKIVSFVGVAPIDNPRYVILVALDTPTPGLGFTVGGGTMCAPAVRDTFSDILPYLGVEPDYTDVDMHAINVSMVNVLGMTEAEAKEALAAKSLTYQIKGSGDRVTAQIPSAGMELPGNSTVILYMGEDAPTDTVEVPKLIGMTVSQANAAIVNSGLYLQSKGTDATSGTVTVTSQSIAADTQVPRGTTITVEFTDTNTGD